MKSRATSVIVAALAAMIAASPAQAGGLKQVAEISIPGDPITDIGIMAIDQTTGLGYLADKTTSPWSSSIPRPTNSSRGYRASSDG